MNLASLRDKPVEWLRGGPADDVVVSSRVRLARNLDGYPFVNACSTEQLTQVENRVRGVLSSPQLGHPLTYVELGELARLLRELLLERRLISRQHAEADWPRGVAFDQEEKLSALVNEEDHIRIQFIRGGLRLEEAFQRGNEFDDFLGEHLRYAYSPRYGYLTACPTNVGTGLRASVMLHLPGLCMSQEMDKVISLANQHSLALRGGAGEGAQTAGDFYQISNQATLGLSEEEIVSSVRETAEEMIEMERAARQNLLENNPEELHSRIERAYRLLSSAGKISSEETLSLLSQLRMGVAMDVPTGTGRGTLDELFLLTLPAHLQTMEGRMLDTVVRDELRAVYVKQKLTGS